MQSDLVFKALADATRRKLLQLLMQHELSVSELVEVLGQPQSTVSRHLRVLREADLISDRRDGTSALYSVGAAVNGQNDGISGPVLEWVSGQKLAQPFARRLDRVLANRSAGTLSFFDEVGRQWDQMRVECFGGRFHLEALMALLPGSWVVADVGTGTGYLLPTLTAAFQQVIAVDPVEAMLEAARSRPDLRGVENVEFRRGDLSALPISDGEVDLVLAILVLHHVPSLAVALAELSRVVKPLGKLLIVEQAAHELAEFQSRMQDRWWGHEPERLVDEVAGAGLRDIEWHPLRTAEATSECMIETPDLFVLTASGAVSA